MGQQTSIPTPSELLAKRSANQSAKRDIVFERFQGVVESINPKRDAVVYLDKDNNRIDATSEADPAVATVLHPATMWVKIMNEDGEPAEHSRSFRVNLENVPEDIVASPSGKVISFLAGVRDAGKEREDRISTALVTAYARGEQADIRDLGWAGIVLPDNWKAGDKPPKPIMEKISAYAKDSRLVMNVSNITVGDVALYSVSRSMRLAGKYGVSVNLAH